MVITRDIILCVLGRCMTVRAVVAPKDFADDVVFYILNVINFFIITTWSTETTHDSTLLLPGCPQKIEYRSTLDKTLNQTICSKFETYEIHVYFLSILSWLIQLFIVVLYLFYWLLLLIYDETYFDEQWAMSKWLLMMRKRDGDGTG